MDRENYYILLELPLDPPASDPGEIKAAISRKRQEWTRWQDHPGKRAQALSYLDAVPDIERVMLGRISREQEAEAAKEIRRDKLRMFEAELRLLEGKGYLMQREASAIAAKYRGYGVDKALVLKTARVPLSDEPVAPQPSEDEGGEVIDRVTANSIRRGLEVLGAADLYAFLGEKPYASIKKLQEAAELRRREGAASGAKTAKSTAAQELAGICLRVFESFDSKQKYDRYLKISKYPALGELIDEEFARARFVSTESMLRLCNFAVETYRCRVIDAEEYIRRYCAAYSIPFGGQKPVVNCPNCGAGSDRESAICTSCAAPLRGVCPGCGNEFEGGPTACGVCGFPIGEMVKALPHIDEAHNALIENSYSVAQRSLQYAKKYWPDHAQIEPLERRAANLEARYARYMEEIEDCVRHRQFYAALELIREAQGRRLPLPSRTVEMVERTVREHEEEIEALRAAGKLDIKKLTALSAAVSDSLELDRLLSRHPPEAPESLKAAVAQNNRQVRLLWDKSGSEGRIDYILVRKEHGAPVTPYDGDILYEGAGNSFTDESAEGLNEYYYRVYARRGGVCSAEGTTTGPVLLIPEIQNLNILPGDGSAQLSWTPNEEMSGVLIWRKLGGEKPTAPGDGFQLENTRIDGYTDTKIKNDVEYWYYLVAVYMVDGKKVYSCGVCEEVVPHRMIAPVESLSVIRADAEDEYIVNWKNSEYAHLLLFQTAKQPAFRLGEVFPVQDLHRAYRSLELHARREDRARFHLRFTGGVWLFAALVSGKFATVGKPVYITNVPDISEPSWDRIGDELYLNMKWPPGLNQILIAWRHDRFPASAQELGDAETATLTLSREEYDYDAAAVLRDPLPRDYYFRIFGVFTAPDGKVSLSEGVEMLVSNSPQREVFYRFGFKKKFMRNSGTISLSISSDQPFMLPRAVLIGKIGRLPLGKSDGDVLFEVEKETRVDGEISYEYEASAPPDNLYIRLFLQEDEKYDKLRLLPLMNLKVT